MAEQITEQELSEIDAIARRIPKVGYLVSLVQGDDLADEISALSHAVPCLVSEVHRLREVEKMAEGLFTSEDTNALLVNILRRWDNAKMRRFAHMLLDRTSPQAGV